MTPYGAREEEEIFKTFPITIRTQKYVFGCFEAAGSSIIHEKIPKCLFFCLAVWEWFYSLVINLWDTWLHGRDMNTRRHKFIRYSQMSASHALLRVLIANRNGIIIDMVTVRYYGVLFSMLHWLLMFMFISTVRSYTIFRNFWGECFNRDFFSKAFFIFFYSFFLSFFLNLFFLFTCSKLIRKVS